MAQEIEQIKFLAMSRMTQSHLVGYMSFFDTELTAVITAEGAAWSSDLKDRYDKFHAAYQRLDKAYCTERYSLRTPEVKEADKASRRIFMSIKKVVLAWERFDLETEAMRLTKQIKQSIDNYAFTGAEDYLGFNAKVTQWIEDVQASNDLTQAIRQLNLEDSFNTLIEKAATVRNNITMRGTERPVKGETRAARVACIDAYNAVVEVINATVVCGDRELRLQPFIKQVNGNIDYFYTTVFPRKGTAAAKEPLELPSSGV